MSVVAAQAALDKTEHFLASRTGIAVCSVVAFIVFLIVFFSIFGAVRSTTCNVEPVTVVR